MRQLTEKQVVGVRSQPVIVAPRARGCAAHPPRRPRYGAAAVLLCLIGAAGNASGAPPLRWPITARDIPPDTPAGVKRAIEGTFSRDAAQRYRAAVVLGRFASRAVPAIPYLLQMPDEPRWSRPGTLFNDVIEWEDANGKQTVGRAAARALALIGKSAVPLLIAIASDRGAPLGVRDAALRALAKSGDPGAVPCLVAALRGPDRLMRIGAVVGLWGLRDPRSAAALLQIARDANQEADFRCEALRALTRIPDRALAEPLLAMLGDEPFRTELLAGADCMDARFLAPLLAALRGRDSGDRRAACFGLVRLGGPRAVAAVVERLLDDKEEGSTRVAAAEAVALSNDAAAVGKLLRLIEGEPRGDFALANELVRALRLSGDDRALDRFFAAVWEADFAKTVASAMGGVESPRAIGRLLAVVGDKRPWPMTKLYACAGLVHLRDAACVEGLAAILADEKQPADNRTLAAITLERFEDARAVPALTAALRAGEADLRKYAARTLGEIGDPRAMKPLTALANDPDKSVQAEARGAIEKIKELSLE
jgi:HEAT repeat protein